MTQDPTPRWQQRFRNFEHAYQLLKEAIELSRTKPLSMLEREGVIQRFEYTLELAWKVMKDYLLAEGVAFDQVTPKAVIREAFVFNLITDGDGWMLALNDRNAMSHTYNEQTFEKIFQSIQQTYFGLLTALYDGLRVQL